MENKLKEKRLQKNITQQELAYLTKISMSQLANIENNRSVPSVEIAIKIAHTLDCIVEEIFYIIEKE
jgi:putative transcriptional regulator